MNMEDIESIRMEKKRKLLEKSRQGSKKPETLKLEVDDSNFQDKVINYSKEVPVVVDFWAPWCQPCLMLGPILDKLVEEYKGKFVLAKLNLDKAPEAGRIFKVRSIPMVVMFKSEKMVDNFIGVVPETQVRQWLNKNIGG
jgi:putative thioredoxin